MSAAEVALPPRLTARSVDETLEERLTHSL